MKTVNRSISSISICGSCLSALLLLAGAASPAWAGDGGTLLGGGLGAAAGAVIGQSVGGKNGAIVGGAVGGATGAAVSTKGSGQSGAMVGGAIGGGAGAAVGQSVGGSTGAVLGAGLGGAAGSTLGKVKGTELRVGCWRYGTAGGVVPIPINLPGVRYPDGTAPGQGKGTF